MFSFVLCWGKWQFIADESTTITVALLALGAVALVSFQSELQSVYACPPIVFFGFNFLLILLFVCAVGSVMHTYLLSKKHVTPPNIESTPLPLGQNPSNGRSHLSYEHPHSHHPILSNASVVADSACGYHAGDGTAVTVWQRAVTDIYDEDESLDDNVTRNGNQISLIHDQLHDTFNPSQHNTTHASKDGLMTGSSSFSCAHLLQHQQRLPPEQWKRAPTMLPSSTSSNHLAPRALNSSQLQSLSSSTFTSSLSTRIPNHHGQPRPEPHTSWLSQLPGSSSRELMRNPPRKLSRSRTYQAHLGQQEQAESVLKRVKRKSASSIKNSSSGLQLSVDIL